MLKTRASTQNQTVQGQRIEGDRRHRQQWKDNLDLKDTGSVKAPDFNPGRKRDTLNLLAHAPAGLNFSAHDLLGAAVGWIGMRMQQETSWRSHSKLNLPDGVPAGGRRSSRLNK